MLDVSSQRSQFPALNRTHEGKPVVYADGPAGSQVPSRVAQAVSDYLLNTNANHGGCFATSQESDALLQSAHQDVAAFLGADDPGCIIFGNNMTTLTFALSRAIARTWQAGDEIILSRCDHDANVSPWMIAAKERDVTVRWIEIYPEDCALSLESLGKALNSKTKLVAVGLASNAVGTIHPVQRIGQMAHEVKAKVFVDAVHYAPHLLTDVHASDADFLVCSAYKFFGPHVGILWGKRKWLEELEPYKVRPASNDNPDRWMTGTQNHEGILGTREAVRYLASLTPHPGTLREQLAASFSAIAEHERALARRFLKGIQSIPQYRVVGIKDARRLTERVPTFSILHHSKPAIEVSQALAGQGIFTWAGNFYALPLTEALDLEPNGMLRIGFLHYNSKAEVDRVLDSLEKLK